MSRAEKLELLKLLEEKERRSRTMKLSSYYPDEGPLRRSLYVKHNQFFEAGASRRERLMLAANRIGKCIAADTIIETPYGEPRKVKDIKGKHWVWAWDGEKRVPAIAEQPFTKPDEMIYRVWLQSGQYVDCAAEHRFLSEAGWIFLSDLFGCVPCLPGSTADIGPSESLEDALCLMNRHQDSQGDCQSACLDVKIPALLTPYGTSDEVVCYQPIGIQPIYDFHVPKYLNYCTAGVIHHNTEGVGGYEMTLHLTGLYPKWWKGKRFDRPITAWGAGDTSKTVREIIQRKLLGSFQDIGTGLIPQNLIHDWTRKAGTPEAVDTIYVKHKSGGISSITLKSYDQKRHSFQGSEIDVIWLDEEPPLDIYTECLIRTMTNQGMLMLTFTPLMGMSETVMAFLPGGQIKENAESAKYVVMATWDDAPHLGEAEKTELWNSIPPFQRDARSKGVPQLGAGAIFPVPESDFVVDDFPIPDHWLRCYGMDVGWNRTAVSWGAYDKENDCLYVYAEHYRGQAEPSIHAASINARGSWIPGVIDPASRGRAQRDGGKLLEDYKALGLDIEVAFNGVESGLYQVWQRLSTGRMKVFKSCSNWLFEFRLYRRDEKGHIVKANDHLMDSSRYLVMSGIDRAKVKPADHNELKTPEYGNHSGGDGGWMG